MERETNSQEYEDQVLLVSGAEAELVELWKSAKKEES